MRCLILFTIYKCYDMAYYAFLTQGKKIWSRLEVHVIENLCDSRHRYLVGNTMCNHILFYKNESIFSNKWRNADVVNHKDFVCRADLFQVCKYVSPTEIFCFVRSLRDLHITPDHEIVNLIWIKSDVSLCFFVLCGHYATPLCGPYIPTTP